MTIATENVSHSAQRSYQLFPKNKYATELKSKPRVKKYKFFNGAIVSATPKLHAPHVSKVSL